MKLKDKIANRSKSRPFYTFEFFPPRTDQGFTNLLGRIDRLASLNPIAISVTWGASGSTKERSLDLAGLTQSEYGVETLLHLTCTNMERGMIDETLKAAKASGIQNILALRGDPPRGSEYWIPTDPRFVHARDLVAYIRASPEYASHFSVGVAGYPDGHPDQEVDEEAELINLKAKVDAGADYIITQLFYDVDAFLSWVNRVRAKGIEVPIIPGILPIQSYASFLRLTKLCGTRVPPEVMAAMEPIKHDDQKVKDYGIDLAINMVRRLRDEGEIPGFHFCTLNLEKSVRKILEGLDWLGEVPVDTEQNKLIAVCGLALPVHNGDRDLIITPHDASTSAMQNLTARPPSDTGSAGRGELNHAATWDEFPNGRFGDFKSPAYGAQDLWNGGLTVKPEQARSEWGHPKTIHDLTEFFYSYLHSTSGTTPFSANPLSQESQLIIPYLEQLTQRGWWTVGSQPAIDAAPSEDEVVGWGPRGGYIFQKAFVEFFADREVVEWLTERARIRGCGLISFFAGNLADEFETNSNNEDTNAVTWGVFPGHEIAQPTIIEQENFLSWKTEAFGIWSEWAQVYPPDSEERRVLEQVRDTRWLISVIHHDFKNPTGLWDFLLQN
ncbi:methylenetetrahydrofolate reductase-domain-containing protein [Hysterangium stoloniferum]|nr:methylenetetrahydrofolate reductase-domain-containing protein [Hysterangium stoloniferum]